jgi:hypothetical protein
MDVNTFLCWCEWFLRKLCLAVGGGIYGAFVSIGVLVLFSLIAKGHLGDVAGLAGVAGFAAGAIGGAWGQKSLPKRIAWAGGSAAVFGPVGGFLLLALMYAA